MFTGPVRKFTLVCQLQIYICACANAALWPLLGISVSPGIFLDIKLVCGSIQTKFLSSYVSCVESGLPFPVWFQEGQAKTATAPPVELIILWKILCDGSLWPPGIYELVLFCTIVYCLSHNELFSVSLRFYSACSKTHRLSLLLLAYCYLLLLMVK